MNPSHAKCPKCGKRDIIPASVLMEGLLNGTSSHVANCTNCEAEIMVRTVRCIKVEHIDLVIKT